ncbi:MAG: sigma-54 dependent transcriptional regulator [Planctomycetaceae bacterium]|nr:sigma-54 dependent transcriptional regulator [Planctomycetaceae bacterium]
MRILIVDDEKIKRVTLADDLATQGHEVVTAADGEEALERLAAAPFDVVVTDMKMPKLDGIELLKRIKQGPQAGVEVIMMTAYGTIPVAVEAVKLGAFDFLTKPFRNEDIFPLLARVERQRQSAQTAPLSAPSEGIAAAIVGQSVAIERVKRMVEIAAKSDANVLLCGETGVGKDLLATTIHRNSHRHGFPYVKVGCTLFPPQLIESELYGHERGSFTGAEQQRKGRFDLAEGGTLYLDDVDDIPLEQQPKLLRAIEEKVFERVGGSTLISADVRIIASTKRNLLELIGKGGFREDLYYRLDVLRINIPPLRDRRDDIPLLADHLLRRIAGGKGGGSLASSMREPGATAAPARIAVNQPPPDTPALPTTAIDILMRHDWPGNVRELYHTLERAYLIGGGAITPETLAAEIGGLDPNQRFPVGGFQAAIDHAEKQLLQDALRNSGGNKTAAAAALGMKPSTFRDKLAKHGLG